ncbi:hypothetical protein WN48_04119 [Eufriesea mexicana]|uniref:Uncharacterized protein n=1 Tax=Eufriesea mexicana TaxID=516756 RepID=A0A310SJM8_9HYME|nr:hypothetical protein WN48_04119 [Eufriesea mexicana]
MATLSPHKNPPSTKILKHHLSLLQSLLQQGFYKTVACKNQLNHDRYNELFIIF